MKLIERNSASVDETTEKVCLFVNLHERNFSYPQSCLKVFNNRKWKNNMNFLIIYIMYLSYAIDDDGEVEVFS